jgi:shikimate dehydrogenase
LAGAIAGLRALGIRGCGVSMPFKEPVLALLDELAPSAREVGAVNTIVNDAGKLTGHNTDVLAASAALARVGFVSSERVLLLGAGGVARAVRSALASLGARDVHVSARNLARANAFATATSAVAVPWSERMLVRPDLVIHATPIGMSPDSAECPLEDGGLASARAVVEIVASPAETALLRRARELGKRCSSGPEFSLDQAAAQFELYTGQAAPREAMERALAGA